jgi:hypothetical protein
MTKFEDNINDETKEVSTVKSNEPAKEPTKEDILKAYRQLDEKYSKLFRAYANLLDLYLGNMPQGEI